MGLKRNIKHEVEKCFVCGYIFKNEKEKHIERIDYDDEDFRKANTVVLCERCKRQTQKGILKIYNTIFIDNYLRDYFKKLGRKVMYLVKMKILRTRQKNLIKNNKKL